MPDKPIDSVAPARLNRNSDASSKLPSFPRPPRNPRRLVLVLSAAILAIILVTAAMAFYRMRGGNSPAQTGQADLPSNPNQRTELPPDTSPTPGPSPEDLESIPPAEKFTALKVTVRRNPGQSFSLGISALEVADVTRSALQYESPDDQPHSLVQVLNSSGEVLASRRVTVFDTALLENFGANVSSSTESLPDSTATVFLPVNQSQSPARVRIATTGGQVFDEKEITENLRSRLPAGVLGLRSPQVLASQSDRDFNIVVTNDAGARQAVPMVRNLAQQMKDSLEPWATVKGRIQVYPRPYRGERRLCQEAIGPGGTTYPVCGSMGAILSEIDSDLPFIDILIVATPTDCNCGVVRVSGNPSDGQPDSFSDVVSIGARPDVAVLAHELGHAVGKLADEYMYQYYDSFDGPNCFASQQKCEEATKDFETAECTQGCDNPSSWRPATRIMHLSYNPFEYGPFENCEITKRLQSVLGGNIPCNNTRPSASPTPTSVPPPDSTLFWGWHR